MDFFVRHWELSLLALASAAMLLWNILGSRLSSVKAIGTAELTRLINSHNALVVDIRETSEYEGGRLPNAVHVPLSQLGGRASELERYKDRPVVAYCERGNRSRMVGRALAKIGFTDMYQLAGGFRAWKDAGLPVEQ